MTGRIAFPIADIPVDFGKRARQHHIHRFQPVRQTATNIFDAFGVAMNHDRKQPVRQMSGIIPAGQLQLFRFFGLFTVRTRWTRIAAVGA